MTPVLLIDFGSTFTKLTAIDLDAPAIIGTAQSFTTIDTDVATGFEKALLLLTEQTGELSFTARYACSSAAGGLRMCASGLVPELTAQAARMAALGAGAKVIKSYAYELTPEDIREIDELCPDIFLLTGGTDGGNRDCIIHNAGMLAHCSHSFPIIVAGNRSAAEQCGVLLDGRDVYITPNVMPTLGKLQTDPVQQKIREVFLRRIVDAKGLSRIAATCAGDIIPTPAAMLDAMTLLSTGCPGEPGIGDFMAVDLGGATTDVYSMGDGLPSGANTVLKGLPEPFAKRTVEGDIGMRYSAHSVLEVAGAARLAELGGLAEQEVERRIARITADPGCLPVDELDQQLDYALACASVEIATLRHAGTLEEVYTPMGQVMVQQGKDLRHIKHILFTGGALIHSARPQGIAGYALASITHPNSLRPLAATAVVDARYILSAMGVLSAHHPVAALKIMRKELSINGY